MKTIEEIREEIARSLGDVWNAKRLTDSILAIQVGKRREKCPELYSSGCGECSHPEADKHCRITVLLTLADLIKEAK